MTERLLFLTYNLTYTALRETKCTVHTLLKNLHLDSVNLKVYMTCNNSAYLYTKSELTDHFVCAPNITLCPL